MINQHSGIRLATVRTLTNDMTISATNQSLAYWGYLAADTNHVMEGDH